MRLRENAESIAFYGGEAREAEEVGARLDRAVANKREILGTQRNLEFFTTAYTYLVQILPVLVVSPLYFAGTIELGVVTQSAGAFNHVLNDLSLIVNQFEGLSSFSAGLGRLATFVERMESYCDASECAVDANATFVLRDEPRAAPARRVEATEAAAAGGAVLAIDGLRLETPDGNRELFGDLSLEVRGGDHLLVTGASGAGKSSLLRAVAGCVEINQCVGCTRKFFTKSFLGDDVAVLARSSGEELASPRHRAGVASMAWRTTR